MGIDFDIIHYKLNPVEEAWEVIPKYRAVITAGRGAVEAMSSGCQVLVFQGEGRFDGWATEDTVERMAQFNYSGRAFNYASTTDNLKRALGDMPHKSLRPWVEEHHDMHKIADRYLSYAL
jgi:hypothetical protein